jgi:hypothetical protein
MDVKICFSVDLQYLNLIDTTSGYWHYQLFVVCVYVYCTFVCICVCVYIYIYVCVCMCVCVCVCFELYYAIPIRNRGRIHRLRPKNLTFRKPAFFPQSIFIRYLCYAHLTPIFPVGFRPDFRSWPPLTGFAITLIGHTTLSRIPSDYQPHAETSTWQHVTLIRDRRPCPRRNSNPKSQQPSGRRLTPYTARPLGSVIVTDDF